MYHNHQKKDASHPWFSKASMPKLPAFTRNFLKSPFAPFLAFPIYLFEGSFDGSHVFPLSKLYRGSSVRAKVECAVSAATVAAFATAVKVACGSWKTLALAYGGCYACFSFWLFMVTYFQHHDHGTKVYDDSDWSYLKGALETIDRVYGFGLDHLHHNISDGHVVHHLFFTQVPHYHLPKVKSRTARTAHRAARTTGHRGGAADPSHLCRLCRPRCTGHVARGPFLEEGWRLQEGRA